MTGGDYKIVIRREGEAFTLTIDPPMADHPPRRFADHREARGAACGLRMVTRWPIDDTAGDAPGAGR